MQGRHQITPQLPLCRSGPDRNQPQFSQPRLRHIVSLPRALVLSRLYNSGCRFLHAIEVTVLRMETTGERWQQREQRSCLGQGRAEGASCSAASLSPPTVKLEAAAAHKHGPPMLQRHSGQLERRCSGADLVSGTRDAEGISPHHHSPGGPQFIQLMSPSALGLPGGLVPGSEASARRGQLSPPCILGHPHQLIYVTKSFSHLTQANLLLQTIARLQNYFV